MIRGSAQRLCGLGFQPDGSNTAVELLCQTMAKESISPQELAIKGGFIPLNFRETQASPFVGGTRMVLLTFHLVD